MMNDQEIIKMLIDNNRRYSDSDLQEMANEDARQGGKGRANAIFTVFLDELIEFYRSIPIEKRNGYIQYEGHQLDGNVSAIINDDNYQKYQ